MQKTIRIFHALKRDFINHEKSVKGRTFLKWLLHITLCYVQIGWQRAVLFAKFGFSKQPAEWQKAQGRAGNREKDFRDERSEYEPKANAHLLILKRKPLGQEW